LQYEFIEGGDLAGLILDWHRSVEPPPAQPVAEAMLQLAEIVAFAHLLDPPIVHRDLKPTNILVQQANSGAIAFKITDFGIGGIAASQVIHATRRVTSPSQFLTTAVRGAGSYLYASPEQFDGKDPDPRDDVHALGVIWSQMMTGNLTRGRPAGMAWRRRFLDRGMSAAMIELLESCFEEQEDRPDDAGVLVERLRALIEPLDDQVKSEKTSAPTRSGPVIISEPKGIVNSIGMKLKLIPAGEFLMGSTDGDPDAWCDERPQRRVRIRQPFYLGIHQVTRGQFRRFVEATAYQTEAEKEENGGYRDAAAQKWVLYPKFTWRSLGIDQTDDHPVVNVSWSDATAFCDWLSRQEDQNYRLPTEAEWEYACRAGTTTRFSFGDDENALGQYAWYSANSNCQTHAVGEKKPNGFGLYDMHGNVSEWCWEGYDAHHYTKPPVHWAVRGGSWDDDPPYVRSAYRDAYTPDSLTADRGFRLARGQSGRSA
jgi:formylglycine-generating enzyme required for sulfatase activity